MAKIAARSIRWMIRQDVQSVAELERAAGGDIGDPVELVKLLKHRSVVGMVAEASAPFRPEANLFGYSIAGWMAYRMHLRSSGLLELLHLTVHPSQQHEGVGRLLVQKFLRKRKAHQRLIGYADVPEERLSAQLFLHRCGFRCTEIVQSNRQTYYRMTHEGQE